MVGNACHSSTWTSVGALTVVYMPQYLSFDLLPSSNGSANTWNCLDTRVGASGEDNITPGPPMHVGAKGCVRAFVQRKCAVSDPYPGTLLPIGRSVKKTPPKSWQNSSQDISGVALAQAASSRPNLRLRSPAARKIAVRLLVPLRAQSLAMIPTKALSGPGSVLRSWRTNSGTGAASGGAGTGALVKS